MWYVVHDMCIIWPLYGHLVTCNGFSSIFEKIYSYESSMSVNLPENKTTGDLNEKMFWAFMGHIREEVNLEFPVKN